MKSGTLKSALGLVAFLSLWSYCGMRADYGWHKRIVAAKEKDGWQLVSKTANVADLTHPWTIFRPAVTRVAFIRLDQMALLDESGRPVSDATRFAGTVLHRTLWVDDQQGEDAFWDLTNCGENTTGDVPAEPKPPGVDLSKVEWRPVIPNTPGQDIYNQVCLLTSFAVTKMMMDHPEKVQGLLDRMMKEALSGREDESE